MPERQERMINQDGDVKSSLINMINSVTMAMELVDRVGENGMQHLDETKTFFITRSNMAMFLVCPPEFLRLVFRNGFVLRTYKSGSVKRIDVIKALMESSSKPFQDLADDDLLWTRPGDDVDEAQFQTDIIRVFWPETQDGFDDHIIVVRKNSSGVETKEVIRIKAQEA